MRKRIDGAKFRWRLGLYFVSTHIEMFIQALLASIVIAQSNLPTVCKSACASFSLSQCASTITPSTPAQWNAVTTQLTNCICPMLSKNVGCSSCLITQIPTASTYWQKLNTACSLGTANTEVASLFNVTLEAVSTPTTQTFQSPSAKSDSRRHYGSAWIMVVFAFM